MRLIDAGKLNAEIYRKCFEANDERNVWNLQIRYKILEKTLRDAPTIDAVPVRHGKWIWKGKDGDSRFMCSECKSKEHVPTCMGVPNIWEYCPNCGARMDKE